MMENVKLVTIEEVCISGSSNISQNKLLENEGDYPIYGASGLIKNVDFYHQDRPYLSIVKDGSGYGRITIMPGKTSVIGTLQYILPKENIMLNYLYYAMLSIDFKKYVSGAAIPHIYFKDYKKEIILLRSLEEQQKIVEKLDKAFELIDQAKANIEQNIINAKELFQSKLDEVFSQKGDGWTESKLGEIALVTAGQSPEGKYYNSEGNGMPFYQGKKEFTDKYIGNPVVWTSKVTKIAKEGDVLMSVRAPVGPVNFATQECCIGRGLASIKALGNFDRGFLFHFFKYIEKQLIGNSGAVFNSINKSQIENLAIIYPEINKQKTINKELIDMNNAIDSLILKYQQKLSNLEELRKSILEKAFKGELTN